MYSWLYFFFICRGHGKNTSSGFIDLNVFGYLTDIEADSVVTINSAATITDRVSYFSLTNFINQDEKDELQESHAYYTEQNIRWKVAQESPLDLTGQFNFRSGVDNDRHRVGLRWRINDTSWEKALFAQMNLKWSINFHAMQWDSVPGHEWQIEHIYRMTFPFLSDRWYLAGFIDHTFNQQTSPAAPSNPVVCETQIAYELLQNFYVIAEYRVNQYNHQDVNNAAAGLEYIMVW